MTVSLVVQGKEGLTSMAHPCCESVIALRLRQRPNRVDFRWYDAGQSPALVDGAGCLHWSLVESKLNRL